MTDINGNPAAEEPEKEEGADSSEEKSAESNEELVKTKKAFEDQKRRAELAEEELKKLKVKAPESSSEKYSPQEIIALGRLHDDDIETVQKWAKFNQTTVTEALKDKDLKVILSARDDERKTAQATQTRGGQRGGAPTGEAILEKASRGEIDEDTDTDKLAEARMAARLKR